MHFLRLLLPVLFPSWRFFKDVGPCSVLEYRVFRAQGPSEWYGAAPRPARLSVWDIVRRLFWNAQWNDHLFLVSCCDRLIVAPTPFAGREIGARLLPRVGADAQALQFRILLRARVGSEVETIVAYESARIDAV